MANFTQNDSTADLPTSSTKSQSTCADRYHDGVQNGELTALTEASFVLAIIVNSIASICTVVLNVLVIVAVKRRPRLQSNTNILLACLAGADLLCGLAVQPMFALWKAFQLTAFPNDCMIRDFHNAVFGLVSVASLLHLSLVTGERLLAIKYTMRYPSVVTVKKIRVAVVATWVCCIVSQIGKEISDIKQYFSIFIAVILIICILFIVTSYAILFREIRRHQEAIKTQQLPQDELERHVREDKAFKTTAYIVSAVLSSFIPMALALLFRPEKGYGGLFDVFLPCVRTFAMQNSLFNPLIYCWRQKEMRNIITKMFKTTVNP
ncbi:histamine H2 receptor-like [Oculina patagonica]